VSLIYAIWAIELIALAAAFIHHVVNGDFNEDQGDQE